MEMTPQEIRETAFKLNLIGEPLVRFASDALVERVCNGIGPEWFPKRLRELIDRMHPSLQVAAAIHDLWYYYGAGTDADFREANSAFRENGIAVAKAKFGWYDPRRYLVISSAKRFASLCDLGGHYAYCCAIAERKRDEEAGSLERIDDLVGGAL